MTDNHNHSIIIIDDERAARFGMRRALDRENYRIFEAEDATVALAKIAEHRPDLAFLDLNMPGLHGMEALLEIQKQPHAPLVIVVTAYGSEKVAVEAMRRGAYDYLSKPYDVDELRLITRNALEKLRLTRENRHLREKIQLQEKFGELIGESKAMLQVYDMIEKIAQTDVTVLITGESGTGKELVAREIYKRSHRSKGKFVPVNCASVPEKLIESELFGTEKGAFTDAIERKGKLEEANKGTLFLDEIGDMGLDMQAKILRVLHDRTFEKLGGNTPIEADVRFISATNKDLEQEIEDENFREDLYYRIKVVDIHMPSLRDRASDIPLLANHFLQLFCTKYKKQIDEISPETMQKLIEYFWPGNVRELKNAIERMVVLSTGRRITDSDLPPDIGHGTIKKVAPGGNEGESKFRQLLSRYLNSEIFLKDAKREFVQEFERFFISDRLRKHNGNVTQTAQGLGIPRQSLQQKLKELDINARDFVQSTGSQYKENKT